MEFDPSTASPVATAEFDPSTAKPAQAFDESTAQPVSFDPSTAKPVAPTQEDPEDVKHKRVMERLGYKPKQQSATDVKPAPKPVDELSDTENRIIRTAITTGVNMADAVQTFWRKARPTVTRLTPFLSKEEKEQELKRMAEQEIGLSDLITGKKKESQTPTIDLFRKHISEIKVDKSKDDTLKAKATEFVTGVVTSLATPIPALSGGLAMGGAAQQEAKAEGKSQDEAERIGMINSVGGTILNMIPFVGNKAISGIENFAARRLASGASAATVNVVGEAAIQGVAEGELSADRLKQAGGIGFGMGLLFGPSFQKRIAGKSREEVDGLIKQELAKMPKDELAQLNKSVADSAKEQGIKLDVTPPEGAPTTITPEQAQADAVRYREIQKERQALTERALEARNVTDPVEAKRILDEVDQRQFELSAESEAIKNRNPESQGMPPGEIAAEPLSATPEQPVDFNVKDGQLEAVEKVDIGERNPEISDGSGTPTPFEQKMMDDWKAQLQKETAPPVEQPAQTAGAGPIHQYLDKKLSEAGLSPAQRTDALTRDGLMAEASKIIEGDPLAGKRVIDDLKESPRAATPQEEALITFEMARVDRARNEAEQRLVEAVKSGNEDLVIRAEAERKKATEEYGRVFDTAGNAVSRSGQALNFAKLLKQSDYTLAGLERRVIAANEGKPLTKDDSAKITELTKQIEAQQKRYEDYRARMSELLMSEETVAPVRRLSEYRKGLSDRAKYSMERIKKRLAEGRMYSNPILDPEALFDYVVVGLDKLVSVGEKGLDNAGRFAKWSESMVRDFGERITPHLVQIYDEARAMRKMHVMELAAEREIKKLERQIAMREPFSPGKKGVKPSDVLAARKARIEELREIRRNIQDELQPKADPELKTPLETYKERTAKLITKWQDKIQSGDLEPAPKKEMLKLDLEASRLEAKLLELKEDADFIVRKKQYENATASEKIRLQALGMWDNTRNIMAGMEFSYVLRQGKTFAESHPVKAFAAQPEMIKALIANPTEAHAINLNIINDPAALDAKHYGLDFTSPDGRLTNQEEFLMSDRLAQKIPIASAGIRRFSMAGSAYLNRVRLEYWKILSKEIPQDDVAGRRQIASWINVATGRSTLDVVRRNQAALGRIFFSASYWASRLQLASQAVKLAVPGTFTPAARVAIAKEYARAMIGHSVRLSLYASMLTLLGHKTSFETDPRSSEFGKLVVDGKTRIDTMAGLGQLVTFLSRSATRQTKTGGGKIEPISAQDNGRSGRLWSDVMVDYTRSKLHPGLSKFWTMMDNKTITGEKADMFNETAELIYPITWGDIYNSFEEQDIPTATALSIMAWYGDGINTYEKNQKKSKLPK